jgi:lipopolysaccharide export LptBFGC system permease protein LptF
MSDWPNIKRARAIRYNLVFGLTCLAFAALYVLLALAGVAGIGVLDFFPLAFGSLGILALIGVWALRRAEGR